MNDRVATMVAGMEIATIKVPRMSCRNRYSRLAVSRMHSAMVPIRLLTEIWMMWDESCTHSSSMSSGMPVSISAMRSRTRLPRATVLASLILNRDTPMHPWPLIRARVTSGERPSVTVATAVRGTSSPVGAVRVVAFSCSMERNAAASRTGTAVWSFSRVPAGRSMPAERIASTTWPRVR